MRNKLLATRNAVSVTFSVLLALCILVVLLFNPWTAYALNGVREAGETVSTTTGAAVPDNASVWEGDLKTAGWANDGEYTAPEPDGYDFKSETELEISTADALAYFAHETLTNKFEGVTVKLTEDIDLANQLWIPIAFSQRIDEIKEDVYGDAVMFSGIFDGNGKTVYNLNSRLFKENIQVDENFECVLKYQDLTVKVPMKSQLENASKPVDQQFWSHEYLYGLFDTAGNAEIKNLSVVNVNISLVTETRTVVQEDGVEMRHEIVSDSVGAIVGYAVGNITMTNCTAGSEAGLASGRVDVIQNVGCAGGLVGRAYSGLYNGKPYGKNAGAFTSANGYVGAEGHAYGEIIFENCTNYITMGTDGESDKKAGMLAYIYCDSSHKFINCVNYGDVHGVDAGGITSYWQQHIGNGYYGNETIAFDYQFVNCKNYGSVYGKNNVGGIFGRASNDNIATSVNKTYKFVISGCENYGTVTNEAESFSNAQGATGGIAGLLYVNYNLKLQVSDFTFENNINYGDVIGLDATGNVVAAGGLIGYVNFNSKEAYLDVSGANCGKVTGYRAGALDGGCIGAKNANGTLNTDLLINAYKVAQEAQ